MQFESYQREKVSRVGGRRVEIDMLPRRSYILFRALCSSCPFFILPQVWSAEEEYLIMKVTLNSIAVLRRWMQRYVSRYAQVPRWNVVPYGMQPAPPPPAGKIHPMDIPT